MFGEMNNLKEIAVEILSRSLDAILVVDSTNQIVYSNPSLSDLSEYSEKELLGKVFSALFPLEKTTQEKDIHPLFFDRGEGNSAQKSIRELELQTKTGYFIPVEIRAFPIQHNDSKQKLFAGVIRDIRERKRLEDQKTLLISSLKRLAFIDELTMLPNRRSFFDSLHKAIATVRRRNRHSVVGVIDIDFFKHINDTYGHDMGDMVLRKMGKIFTDSLRDEDIVGRIGGEEFACILPDTEIEGARIVLERLRNSVRSHQFFIMENFYLNVTISIGFTQILGDKQVEDMLKLADLALYEAKNSGRDQVKAYRLH